MANTYTLIASSTVGSGGAANITFSSIPATYTDLCLVVSSRNTGSGVAAGAYLTLNTDTNFSNYSYRRIEGNGSTVSSQGSAGGNRPGGVDTGDSATANTFSNTQIYIPNYAGSTNKSYSIDSVSENNATTAIQHLIAGLWSNTSAINSIAFSDDTYNLAQYSTAYLYGISSS
jgi:hypothetical protein